MSMQKDSKRGAGNVRSVVRTAQAHGWLLARAGTMRNGQPTRKAMMTVSAIDAIVECTKANGNGLYFERSNARRMLREVAEWYGIAMKFDFANDRPFQSPTKQYPRLARRRKHEGSGAVVKNGPPS